MIALPLASTVGPSAYWYLTRSTGTMGLILLTVSIVLGVIDVERYASVRWPRFVVDGLHRTVSLLALAFVIVHIVTSVLDSFASIRVTDAIIPFTGTYRPFWLGLGAASFDLVVAVVITSLARKRLGFRAWRVTHWLVYASWPVALLHSLGTGSDVKESWMLILSGVCLAAVVLAAILRVASGWRGQAGLQAVAIGVTVCFAVGVVAWLPGGPLGHGWARRAGTPSVLLHPVVKAARR